MKILVIGAGITGSGLAVRLHDAGNDVTLLARGNHLAELRENGVRIAIGSSPDVRTVRIPVVDRPAVGNGTTYDLIAVCVRTHHVDAVLESLVGVPGDVLLLLNWAAGPAPLAAVLGDDRVLLGFATEAGTWDGDVVRLRAPSVATRFVSMPFGEPDGTKSARLDGIVRLFCAAGVNAKVELRIDAWLTTHAAFEVPLGQAVKVAGGLHELADDPDALRRMVRRQRRYFAALDARPVPRAFGLIRVVPERLLVAVYRLFLRSSAAEPLGTTDPASAAELDRLAEQLAA